MGISMNRKVLTGTDLNVSDICLGTAEYGTKISEADSWKQMDCFLEAGGNFIDTARIYADWIPGERGRSEHTIGKFLKASGKRQEVIISTKGVHSDLVTGKARVNPECIREDLEKSLEALQTDYIDLYFLHRDDIKVPAEELLGTLEEARKAGKIRWYGCSNWTLERLKEADRIAEREGMSGFVCNQLMWSLADINRGGISDTSLVMMDQGTYSYHTHTKKSVMAFTSIAKGYLTKKAEGREITPSLAAQYENPVNDRILELVREAELPISEFAFAYFFFQLFPAVPIASFHTVEQLEIGIKSSELNVPEGLINDIKRLKKHSI